MQCFLPGTRGTSNRMFLGRQYQQRQHVKRLLCSCFFFREQKGWVLRIQIGDNLVNFVFENGILVLGFLVLEFVFLVTLFPDLIVIDQVWDRVFHTIIAF